MTKTNSISSKLVVGFVATALLFTLSYTPARAASMDELQAQIAALMAQIASLQGGSSSGSMSTCYIFTTDMKKGSKGSEVMELQKFLIAHGYTIPAEPRAAIRKEHARSGSLLTLRQEVGGGRVTSRSRAA